MIILIFLFSFCSMSQSEVFRPANGDLFARPGPVDEGYMASLDTFRKRPSTQGSTGGYRFGQLSQNSFFTRHNPHPSRVRHIKGKKKFRSRWKKLSNLFKQPVFYLNRGRAAPCFHTLTLLKYYIWGTNMKIYKQTIAPGIVRTIFNSGIKVFTIYLAR